MGDLKTLYVNRGLPGSGKSTRAKRMAEAAKEAGATVVICSSDDFFVCPCCSKYNFDLTKLGFAHRWCQEKCSRAMHNGIDCVIIDNTNVTSGECRPYVLLAQQHGYQVEFLEPQTPWAFDLDELEHRNVHGVPRGALERMLRRWVPNMTVEAALGRSLEGLQTEDEKAVIGGNLPCHSASTPSSGTTSGV